MRTNNEQPLSVRRFKVSDVDSINQICRALHPDWFTEEALLNISRDIRFARCFVAEWNEKLVGFISVHSYDGKPMIGWLGVDPRIRGKGVGNQLIQKVEQELNRYGYKTLRVETVGECFPTYQPYTETLKFYKSCGFEIEKRGRLRENMGFKWRLSTLKKMIS